MGKSKKRYLTRRILAMILAAAMTITMVPSTALAAPAGDDAEEGIVNVVAEENGDVNTPEDDSNPEDAGDVVPDGDTADDAVADENANADDAAIPEDKAGDDATTDGGKSEVKAEGDTAATPVYEISIGEMETKAVYTGYMPFDLYEVKLTKTENGTTSNVNDETVTMAWKVQGGDAVDAPINVGVYELTLTCAEKADVHAALTKTVTCEITKAFLTIEATAAAKPGAEAKKANITAAVTGVWGAEDDPFGWTPDDIALEVTGVREAYGAPLAETDILKKNGDYVADVKPSLKADASEDAKNAVKNYELPESLAVNVRMAPLVQTQVVVTLTDKWKEAGKVTLHVYDKNEANVPANPEDYDVKVQYWDDTAESAGWKDLEGAEAVGEWGIYDGCETDENGKVKAPTNAGEYTYFLIYEDTKEGKYDKYDNTRYDNYPNAIKVVIDPAPVTVEIANTEKLTVPAGTVMTKVLSQVDYKATTKDRKDAERVIKAETEHIWGTGYDDINVSQIYKPAFTLQVKNGSVWEDIDNAAYRMQSGKTYRVIYDGKKAIYNADGSYAHRTGINSGRDDNGEEINGADSNYLTDETPTADAKALEVEVQAGEEMEWDLTALLADGKAGETPEKATAKDFDNTALYEKKADYKSKVKLKGATKTLDAVGSDFTYKWYKNDAADLLDKQIMDQNKANELSDVDFDNSWNDLGSILAPTDAGIYKLEITYQDNTDDDTLYYVKPDEKGNEKAVVYYVINKIQLSIVPEAGTYETLAGRSPYDYFIREKNIDTIEYKVLKDGNAYTFPESLGKVEPKWGVLENIADQAGEVDTTWYPETTQYRYFSTETGYTYEIQAQDLGRRVYSANGDYNYFSSITKINNNYTLYKGEKKESDVGDKKWAYRENVLLSGKTALTVNAMGTTELTFEAATPLAYEKTYDGKALTLAAVKPEEAYALKANGQPVTDLDVVYTCVEKTYGSWPLEGLRNAGEYEVYVNFNGDKTYAPLKLEETDPYYGKLIGTVTIKKCQITLALDVDETYEAGYMNALWSDIKLGFKVTGYVKNEECDHEWAFSADAAADYEGAWGDYPSFYVNQKGWSTRLYEGEWILHRGGEFEIHYDADYSALTGTFARNYEVQNAAEVLDTFKTVAKPVYVASADPGSVKKLDITAPVVERDPTTDDITQTIEVREGIPYTTYGIGTINEMKGNLAAFRIYAPEEFDYEIPDTAMYKNEVEKIGGKVVSTTDNYFVVLFDAATAEGEKKVNIRWADKYYETIIFKMDQKLCLGDLTKAVAPKSLAFNAAPKKLAVGESVQLDVKITKKQMTDVICLGYESSDDTIMHVDPDSGYVTALKKEKATITVYPIEMDKDGNKVKIQGFKPVTVSIEGTAVTAPKSVKVLAHGNYALVNYDGVVDGYRREIYVVDNNKNPNLKKAADIEKEVQKLQGNKNQWRGTFAIAPLYLDSADENYGRSYNGFWYKAELSGLQKETSYTVYVRNVCDAKTLPDGYVITQETVDRSAAGTAASFKSLKSEEIGLKLELDETLEGIDLIGSNAYRVELSKFAKGLVSKTSGRFRQNESDTAADSNDTIWLELPLKEMKDSYQDPKLEYYVYATDKNGKSVKAAKNNYVSVDKKGKIKLTGVTGWASYDEEEEDWYYGGGVWVYVRDTNTGTNTSIKLVVVADVDSVTAKKKAVNLTVGQTQNLNDIALYTYKAGKTKLSSYMWPNMDMDAVREAVKEKSEYFELGGENGDELRAIKAGGTLKLSLTDKTVKNNAANEKDATAEITFSSKELASVKKIKAIDITNDQFGLTFTSAGYPDAFRVEIRDSSNNLLLDKSYDIDDEAYEVWEMAKDRKARVRVKDAYRIDADTIKGDILAGGKRRLAKESQYTVKITALCGDVASKAATAKVKTTKIPAVSYWLHDNDEYWNWDYQKQSYSWYGRRGGMSIQVSEYGNDWKLDGDNSGLYVLSGNSYTLTAEPTNRGRVNDTLVWTVGNKKVATVKAAAGTYCITLKGMQPGNTTLEVKSKILGKMIARYDIHVAAVGDAYKNGYKTRYYGDDESDDPGESYNPVHDGDNAPEYLPLSVGDARKTKGNYSYFSFTAQETGKYNFIARNESVSVAKQVTDEWDNVYWKNNDGDLGWMKEGQTVYLRSSYNYSAEPYYVEIEQTERMESASDGMTVTGRGSQENLEFKAPKAGVYQFTLTDSSDADTKEYLSLYTDFNKMISGYYAADENGNTITWELQQDQTVWLRTDTLTDGKTYTLGTKDVTPTALPSGDVEIPSGSDTVYAFTANASGIYRLAVTVETAKASDVTLRIYDSALKVLKNEGDPLATAAQTADANGKTTKSVDMLLEAGQTVYLNPVNGSDAALKVTVEAKKDDSIKTEISTAGTPIKLAEDTEVKAVFTASETGIYTFTTDELSEDYEGEVAFTVYNTNGVYDPENDVPYFSDKVQSGNGLSMRLGLGAGQMIVWTIKAGAAVDITLKAELSIGGIVELKPSQSAPASVSAGSAAGFIFTAPAGGYYSFWSESNGTYLDTYGILYDIDKVDAATCFLNNDRNIQNSIASDDDYAGNGHFGISRELQEGQTVYLKSMMLNNSNSGSFTVHAAAGYNAWQN